MRIPALAIFAGLAIGAIAAAAPRGAMHRQSLFCERLSGAAARTTPPAGTATRIRPKTASRSLLLPALS